MKLKAGALYFSIVIAFFIAIISASLIMLAAHYRSAHLKEVRYQRLQNNLNSGIDFLLADVTDVDLSKNVDLFNDNLDSVEISKKKWGLYDLSTVKAFTNKDTLSRVFLVGLNTSKDRKVLYLADEDRPLSVSGETRITGDAEIPKSGIKQSYAEGKPYTGDQLLYGKKSDSGRKLKELENKRLKYLEAYFDNTTKKYPILGGADLHNGFKNSTKIFTVPPGAVLNSSLSGNIILVSDSSIIISANAKLDNIQIFAHTVTFESGFRGNCQVFASDSILVKNDVKLNYPSVLGVIRKKGSADQPNITSGENFEMNGILFSYEQVRSSMQTIISLGKKAKLNGEVYATGLVKLDKGVVILGKVSANRFIMTTPTSLYENFLIDVTFNRKARSKYYLSSALFSGNEKNNKILKWLN
nr:hypothetical protein [Pedobacter sp. ASV2]